MTTEENMTWLQAWEAMESLAAAANIEWFETIARAPGNNQVRLLETMAMECFVNEYVGKDVDTIRKCLIALRKDGFLY